MPLMCVALSQLLSARTNATKLGPGRMDQVPRRMGIRSILPPISRPDVRPTCYAVPVQRRPEALQGCASQPPAAEAACSYANKSGKAEHGHAEDALGPRCGARKEDASGAGTEQRDFALVRLSGVA
jgi:hypothetical protein